MNPLIKRTLTRLLAAGCCLWIATTAQAAGLGGISVNSALGQPLSAEIEVSALLPDEFASVVARIASPEDYAAARLVFVPFLRQLRVAAERRSDGRTILKIISFAAVNEPTLDLLVDFGWRGGRLLQKYSILLDPPPPTPK